MEATGFNIRDNLEHWSRLTQVHLADTLRGHLGRHLDNVTKVLIDANDLMTAKDALSIKEAVHAITQPKPPWGPMPVSTMRPRATSAKSQYWNFRLGNARSASYIRSLSSKAAFLRHPGGILASHT